MTWVALLHRAAAFNAAEYMMDLLLKTRALFWKRKTTLAGSLWLDTRVSDQLVAERWRKDHTPGQTNGIR